MRADEKRKEWRIGGGTTFFKIFFFLSFIGDYAFQRDLHYAATRLDHQASEREPKGRNLIERDTESKTGAEPRE